MDHNKASVSNPGAGAGFGTLVNNIPVLAPIRICIETGIFQHLAEAGQPVTAEELAGSLRGVPESGNEDMADRRAFAIRMLRPICAIRLADEVEAFVYRANDLTDAIADPRLEAGFKLIFDNAMGPKSTMAEMLTYCKMNGYKGPASADDGPFQRARDIVGTSTFQHWIQQDPIQLSRLSAFMQRVQRDRAHWTDWFPPDAIFGSEARHDKNEIFFVDVGGGLGHDISAVAAKYPDKQVRVVLQDLPNVIDEGEDQRTKEQAKLDTRIELSKHDFFQPQPIKGAKIYFMHKIIHVGLAIPRGREDLDEFEKRNGPGLEVGCPVLPTAFDITMLALHSSQERDEEMWTRLVSHVDGLTVRKFWQPPGEDGEGIVEVIRSRGKLSSSLHTIVKSNDFVHS